MKPADRYAKIVAWSDDDGCYVGRVPGLMDGGCHGDDPKAVFDDLCRIADEIVALYLADGKPLPEPVETKRLVELLDAA